MKRFMAVGTNRIWILILVSCVYSINSFAMNDRKNHSNDALKTLTKDCISCSPEFAAGNPLEGNKSALLVAMVSSKYATKEESEFQSYLNMYCMIYPNLDGARDFKKKIADQMPKTATDGNMDRYWLEPGCEPRYIAGTMSPIIHLTAENSTDRMQFVQYLKKLYETKNDLATFKKILNSKNTQGQTVLDYIQYIYSNKRFIPQEEAGLNAFVKYLCDNGAEFSTYKKTCPGEYLKLY
ncbi:MAG: hypothetical protein H7281_11315 [Bacteriovorax sp.]|nr:hypothetical protein [Bacteriovorax sp.]